MERLTERELYNGKVCFTKCEKMECKDKCSCCDVPKEAIKKLKKYEDLEEQGLLLKLPCKMGERVYEIYRFLDEGAWEIDIHKIKLEDLEKIGKTVFLTQAEAEDALKRMEMEE